MANTKNSQKVIEAEANLQVAQMLEAFSRFTENLKKFREGIGNAKYYNRDFDSSRLNVKDMLKASSALVELIKSTDEMVDSCAIEKDMKLIDDVVSGIQLKAKYEMQIDELEHRIQTGIEAYKKTVSEFDKMKQRNVEIFSKLGLLSDDETKDVVKNYLREHSTTIMTEAIEASMPEYFDKKLKERNEKCDQDQAPF